MAFFIAFPILSGLIILQTAMVSHMRILQGTADLILVAIIAWGIQKPVRTAWSWGVLAGLFVGYVSAAPFGAILVGYLLAVALAVMLRQRVWQLPILAMLLATFFGTLLVHLVEILALRLVDTPLPFWEAINLITLPSILLNLVLAIPMYAMFNDLARWLYPQSLEM